MDLHCSCEWSHAFDHIDSERMAIVRKSNVFQECDSKLKEDCGEFIEINGRGGGGWGTGNIHKI